MKVAYVDHSYHQVTRSTRFVLDEVLAGHDVTEFWDESWAGNPNDELVEAVVTGQYDLIVVFQAEFTVQRIAAAFSDRPHANIVFIPMWDGCRSLGEEYWRSLAGVRIVSFARTLHERVSRYGLLSLPVQFFPDPAGVPSVASVPGSAVFLWWRVDNVGWPQLRRILGPWKPDRVHLHFAPDPQVDRATLELPTPEEAAAYHLTTSTWFEDGAAFRRVLHGSNIFVAPRLSEGIGMAMLEAMAAGMCVLANDMPTMSEYIVHGVNGLLADFTNPAPVDFSDHARMGRRARDFVAAGHVAWGGEQALMRDFMLSPPGLIDASHFNALRYLRPVPSVPPAGAPAPPPAEAQASPRVTVVTVVRDDPNGLATTIANVAGQDYPDLEYIVMDGGSAAATLDVIRRNEAHVTRWFSEPDFGPFDAMNRAAALAGGEYVIFMNAGDWFAGPDAISRAMRDVPRDADFVIGHHIFRIDEEEQLHRAEDFDRSWARLKHGPVDAQWLQGIPGHQATFTRTSLLRSLRYDCRFRICADHDFMYRAKSAGARFHHSLETVSVYVAGGLSARNRSRLFDEWVELAERHGGPEATAFFEEIRAQARRSEEIAEPLAAPPMPEPCHAAPEPGGLQRALAEREARVAALEEEIARIRRSASWMITWPMRWVMRRFGLLRRVWTIIPVPGRNREL